MHAMNKKTKSRIMTFKTRCLSLLSLVSLALPLGAQPSALSPQSSTEALMLLVSCIERLPSEPYEFTGNIVMRSAYGSEVKRFKFKSKISWVPGATSAEYEIFSTAGVLIETVSAARRGSVLTLTRTVGPEREPAPPPAPNDSVQGTDVTWLDIMMDFVWWKNPTLDGHEKIKGQNATIVRVEPSEPIPGCAAVRLWIDNEQQVILQATQIDENNKVTRRMWVRSVQKIDNEWLVKDIEVETPGKNLRTKITVESAKRVEK